MKWSTPPELRQQVQRWWDKGEILGNSAFPRRLTLKIPTATELRDHFEAVRLWSQQLRDMPHIRLEMRDFRHQVFGQNALPDAAWIDDAASAIALIGKQKEARIFAQISTLTAARQPKLLAWLNKRPLRALELAERWEKLLAVTDWLLAHPRPAMHVRQMDIAGVHTKFVEANRGVLSEWLDLVLPPEAIEPSATGSSQFNRRYGFLDKPERIRLRWLDPACSPFPSLAAADLTLDAASFARLNPAVDRVFITENEINFLAFPPLTTTLLIFGAGYGFSALANAAWLRDCKIHYWGDIDTHGFAILDELRSHFPPVQSLLMDRATLLSGRALWTKEPTPTQRELPRLTPEERALYDDLRDNRLGKNLRLEQERISFGDLLLALQPNTDFR
ncbi:MAG: hypothetical protein CVU16_08250 [Betaproteobacteria bacterium HGW-Betaproteobacteria-10]|nr:MAG: hypothetical protein CVU16_08250 [Betaproteobacteria bacterium HGW-Betaproteobacteria-10]